MPTRHSHGRRSPGSWQSDSCLQRSQSSQGMSHLLPPAGATPRALGHAQRPPCPPSCQQRLPAVPGSGKELRTVGTAPCCVRWLQASPRILPLVFLEGVGGEGG